ncbi:MAG: lipoate--protein ligase family protein [Candidatus Kryptonium sp.]|nr:lipoate--protein ligase family protein [Candidatus Kryptonium sp.]MCX7762623.1 lipoate--protein ligase family protein [Candidatus Kryptonium sp.]MDW8109653.1 lipoate--protein ligase family protein [Candidatus Kryptonium sp.]
MTSNKWIFLNTGFNDGEFNMRFDENLARLFAEGKIKPVLRVYGWRPYTISIGYNQDEKVFDFDKIKKTGIGFVRRPTGGRAILHSEELTYSVVMSSGGKSVLEIYNMLSKAIARGLSLLGVEFELEESQPDFKKLYREFNSIPCFASSAKYEIHYKGRKIVGSAQRRYGDVVLQHGSILIGEFHKKLPEFLKIDSQDLIEQLKDEIENKTISLNEIFGRQIKFEEVADVLKRGFEIELGIEFEEISQTKFQEIIS